MILKYLKEETQELHHDVESTFYGKKIMDGSLTHIQYTDMIVKNQYIFHSIEGILRTKFADFFEKSQYQPNLTRQDLLDSDIISLGAHAFDFSVQLPVYSSAQEIVGALYVLEGSMLGGKMIARGLKRNANLDKVLDYYFYNSDKDIKTGWNEFRTFIAEFITSTSDYPIVLQGAVNTFNFFKSVYQK